MDFVAKLVIAIPLSLVWLAAAVRIVKVCWSIP